MVYAVLFPFNAAIQKITGIELDGRFRGQNVHYPPGFGSSHRSGRAHGTVVIIENEVVVIAALYILYPGADDSRLPEI